MTKLVKSVTAEEQAEIAENVALFLDTFTEGVDKVIEACTVYARTVAKFPMSRVEFREASPTTPGCIWARIELVGLKAMHPDLMWATGKAAGRLRRLPMAQQTLCLEAGVDVLLEGGETLKVKPLAMTQFQLRQAFTHDNVRSLAEQRAWLESYKSEHSTPKLAAGDLDKCFINGKTFVVNEAMTFTAAQLKRVLKFMEGPLTQKKVVR